MVKVSCWIVSKQHIDYMVTAILRSEAAPDAGTDPTEIGQILWDVNTESFRYRYEGRYPEDEPQERYTYAPVEITGDLFYLFKVFECYEYQSCEHPGWKTSRARAWVRAHMDMWLREIHKEHPRFWVDNTYSVPAYNAAPWGI